MEMTLHTLEGHTSTFPFEQLRMTPAEISKCFQMIIPYPKQADPEFAQVESIVAMGGAYFGTIIADFLLMSLEDRHNEALLLHTISESLCSEVQAIIDSIESTWCEVTNDWIPDDPNDSYMLSLAQSMLYSGYESPISIYNMTNRIAPLLRRYYSHILIDSEIDIWADWDYDMYMVNDNSAVIFFADPENIAALKLNFNII